MDPTKLDKLVRMAEEFEKTAQLNSRSGLVMDVLNAGKRVYQQGVDVLPAWLRQPLEQVRAGVRTFYGAAHQGNTQPQVMFKLLENINTKSQSLMTRISENEQYMEPRTREMSGLLIPELQGLMQASNVLASNPAMHSGIKDPSGQARTSPTDEITPTKRPTPRDVARVAPRGPQRTQGPPSVEDPLELAKKQLQDNRYSLPAGSTLTRGVWEK